MVELSYSIVKRVKKGPFGVVSCFVLFKQLLLRYPGYHCRKAFLFPSSLSFGSTNLIFCCCLFGSPCTQGMTAIVL